MLLNKIYEIIKTEFDYLYENELELDTTFSELGFSSVNLMTLILCLEVEFNVIFDNDIIMNLESIREIYDYLHKEGITYE